MSAIEMALRVGGLVALGFFALCAVVGMTAIAALVMWHGAGLGRRAPRCDGGGADAYADPFGDFPLVDGSLGWTPDKRRTGAASCFGSAGNACPADAAAMPIAAADAGGDGASHPLGQTPPASIILPNDCFVWPTGLLRRKGSSQ